MLSTIDKLKQGLSTIDKPLPKHNTQKEIAKTLNWSTGKVAMADRWRIKQDMADKKTNVADMWRIKTILADAKYQTKHRIYHF